MKNTAFKPCPHCGGNGYATKGIAKTPGKGTYKCASCSKSFEA